MIQLDDVSRRFGSQLLFERLSWLISARAHVGLVGPNGAGKTTLLRILAGLDLPDDGKVHKPRSAEVGYLPQEVETIGGGTVLEVVLSGSRDPSRLASQLEQLEHRLSGLTPGDPEGPALATRYGDLRHRFEALGGDELEARAKVILSGLGIPPDGVHDDLRTLSGGWRMRVVLARLLLGAPDLLLLDEPTNHLDLEALDWLEGFLDSYEGAFVIVSHDRYFLNRMVEEIAELDRGRLTRYRGNYDAYHDEKQVRRDALEKAAKQQAREVAKVERFIERFRYKNTKAKQVQSRVRALDKVERIRTESESRRVRFGLPEAPRSGEIVVRAEKAEKRFGSKVVFDGLDLLLRRGDRIALVGPNGAGKTTLLRLIAGVLPVDGGSVETGHNVLTRYYAQHQLDALDPASTVLEEAERSTPAGERPRIRKLLGRFLFSGEAVDKRVGVLSGGEKARLALAKLLLRPANLLLLDEPTNHLDLPSREMLEDAINEYRGALIVVSHDRYFINRVVTRIGVVGGGRIELYEGDYDTFRERRQDAEPEPGPVPEGQPSDSRAERDARKDDKRRDAELRNQRYRERKRKDRLLRPLEDEIAALEERVRECETLQADPAVYRDAERAAEVGRSKAEAAERLDRLYADWERAAADVDDD